MLRHLEYTRTRILQITERFAKRVHAQRQDIDPILISPRVDRIPYEQATRLEYAPTSLGVELGPLWATYWFKLRAPVPAEWAGQRVDLLWSTRSEGTLWVNGQSVQGLNHSDGQDRTDAVLLHRAQGGETVDCYVETACNTVFGGSGGGDKVGSNFRLNLCALAAFDPLAWDIHHDLRVLLRLHLESKPSKVADWSIDATSNPGDLDASWAGRLLGELNRFCNEVDEEERATWPAAREILRGLLRHVNAAHTHELSAIGHAHIDTAWLWPLAETTRKCIRSFSTAVSYMDRYPEYRFACSQAYQYADMMKSNPDLYQRIAQKVQSGQFIPVGGTWIEPDCNLPSGESLCRQFLLGQRFFERQFGRRCEEFWNPDVFGYNGQLPQIMRLSGIKRFLTQKLSWNRFTAPMHHTFFWEGIDGSRVLAHFPPSNTYNADCSIAELRKQVRNYKDNDRSSHGYYLFGYGDGGGGPTPAMLEALRRTRDLQGVPRCAIRSPGEFFSLLEQESQGFSTVVGELYFEMHRGTYTTQARTKRGNRRCEFLLHEVEFLAAVASRRGVAYPAAELQQLWEVVLLHQFHDILPGSSITLVYEDTHRAHDQVLGKASELRHAAAAAVAGPGGSLTPINTLGAARSEVAQQPDGTLVFVEAPSLGLGQVRNCTDRVVVIEGETITLENAVLRAVISKDGSLRSLLHKPTGREALSGQGNALILYDDRPTQYDAWDVDPYHLEKSRPAAAAHACRVTRREALRAEVTFERKVGRSSSMTQVVRLEAQSPRLEFHNTVDWNESNTMLKAAFPLSVRNMNATYEMQFGAVERPTHFNDPAAVGKYEVPAHRWADLSEFGFGVALLNDCKYGYSTHGNMMHLSLLRSPQSPDPSADRGRHEFAYALMPHAGDWRSGGVVAEALRFNVPVLWAQGSPAAPRSFFEVDHASVMIDTVKQAEDSSAVVVRMYECHGGRGRATLRTTLPATQAAWCNVLEDVTGPATVRNGQVEFEFGPYQILTLRLG